MKRSTGLVVGIVLGTVAAVEFVLPGQASADELTHFSRNAVAVESAGAQDGVECSQVFERPYGVCHYGTRAFEGDWSVQRRIGDAERDEGLSGQQN